MGWLRCVHFFRRTALHISAGCSTHPVQLFQARGTQEGGFGASQKFINLVVGNTAAKDSTKKSVTHHRNPSHEVCYPIPYTAYVYHSPHSLKSCYSNGCVREGRSNPNRRATVAHSPPWAWWGSSLSNSCSIWDGKAASTTISNLLIYPSFVFAMTKNPTASENWQTTSAMRLGRSSNS